MNAREVHSFLVLIVRDPKSQIGEFRSTSDTDGDSRHEGEQDRRADGVSEVWL